MLRFILALVLTAACASAHAADFDAFKTALWPDAQAKGITRTTFDLALRGVTPDPRVIAATKRQPEYGKPVGDYINALASASRVQRGREKAREWAKTFDAVERKFAVERWVLLALWGMETDYGAAKDRWDVFRSLATLAYAKYRHPYFRNELMVAMKIMQEHRLPREQMVSSWAGAMGQTQFMPSNFVDYAIDFSGDGKPDIWNNVADVLGSTGNYLHKGHWIHGLPWGFEVSVPPNFDMMISRGSFTEWGKRGLTRVDGKPFPPKGDGILFFPAGARGPAFIVTENYAVLKEYNNSDAYAIAVGHLADRLAGGGPIKAAWPKDDHPLSRDARIDLQMSNVGARVVIAQNELSPIDIEHRVLFQPRPAAQPQPQPLPPGNPSTSMPGEDVPVSMNVPPSAQDLADAERDHMMLATADDGESIQTAEDDGRPNLQFAFDVETDLEAQPVLEFLSARRKAGHRIYARGPEAEYAAQAKSNTASLSIFISRRDARLYVRKDAQPLFDMPITITEPEKPLGTHVFTAVSEESPSKLRWTVVSASNQAAVEERTPAVALERLTLPQDAIDRINDVVSVGTTLIVSDAGLGRTAAVPNADFAVVLH